MGYYIDVLFVLIILTRLISINFWFLTYHTSICTLINLVSMTRLVIIRFYTVLIFIDLKQKILIKYTQLVKLKCKS